MKFPAPGSANVTINSGPLNLNQSLEEISHDRGSCVRSKPSLYPRYWTGAGMRVQFLRNTRSHYWVFEVPDPRPGAVEQTKASSPRVMVTPWFTFSDGSIVSLQLTQYVFWRVNSLGAFFSPATVPDLSVSYRGKYISARYS